MQQLLTYLNAHRGALMWISILSVVMFLGSLLLMPVLIARAPVDYFVNEREAEKGALAWLSKLLRNLLGVVLMLAGIAMLVLPGQGLLMMLLALMLLDIPGKHRLVQRIVKQPAVWRALSYLRQRAQKPPFEHP
ncbi:MAG: hypothetical protein JWN04_5833 [Myxococcaceae bacterium]|nr:hypothetical protein [Myxococcaceae bacterium]